MKRIYLAGPLFTEAEQNWHRLTKQRLEKTATAHDIAIDVIWPYELITPDEITQLGTQARPEIFQRCKTALERADVMVALLDGTQVDDGTAWEVGYFYAYRKHQEPIIGIRTDFRSAGESPTATVNAMIEIACDQIVTNTDALQQQVLTELTNAAR